MRNSICRFAAAYRRCIGISRLTSAPALAVPAYAEQTGQPCTACHVGGFGPQLTPFGRTFKMEGYTMRAGDAFTLPVSAMAVASYIHTSDRSGARAALSPPTTISRSIRRACLWRAASAIISAASRNGPMTALGRAFSWDNIDLRATTHETVDGHGCAAGREPHQQSRASGRSVEHACRHGAFPIPIPIWCRRRVPAQCSMAGLRKARLASAPMRIGIRPSIPKRDSTGRRATISCAPWGRIPPMWMCINGAAPYLRVAYQKDYGDQNFEIGAFGIVRRIFIRAATKAPAPPTATAMWGWMAHTSSWATRTEHLYAECALHL